MAASDPPRPSWGPVSVSRRPSEVPPPVPKGGIIEMLYDAWTPFNQVIGQHLAQLLAKEFTEERVYALGGEPRPVRFIQTIELAVLDSDTLAERSGVPFFDGDRVGVLFVDGSEGPPIRAVSLGDLVKLKNRSVPYEFSASPEAKPVP